ncbi:MFS transporter [Streptomyces bobili]
MDEPDSRKRVALLLLCAAVFKGPAAAHTAPAALSLITTTFTEGAQRNRALGVYALAGATGYSGGLIASGLLTEVSWRLVFFFPVPIALLVLVLAPLVLPRVERSHSTAKGFDGAGAVTITAGVLLPALFGARPGQRPVLPQPQHRRGGRAARRAAVLASGLITSSIQIGAGIGVALPASLMATGGPGLDGYRLAFLVAGGFSLLGATLVSIGLRARVGHETQARA